MTGGAQIQSVTFPSTFQQGGSAPTNRIASVTNNGATVNYTYDAAGNVTNDGLHSYTYDAENRVVNVDGGATAQYRYDQQNRRVTKIVGSSWTHYVWQGAQVIGEHDATTAYSTIPTYQVKSARLDYIYSGARMIRSRQRTSSTAPWVTQYYLSDRLSVRMTLDSSGNVLGRQAHLPFGEDFGESGTQEKHHFTGYERDGETGLDYAINRGFAATSGRFVQADHHRESGYLTDAQSWNRYSYTRNSPIDRIDELGLQDTYVNIPYWDYMNISGATGLRIDGGGAPRGRYEPLHDTGGELGTGGGISRINWNLISIRFLNDAKNQKCKKLLKDRKDLGVVELVANSVQFIDVREDRSWLTVSQYAAGYVATADAQNAGRPLSDIIGSGGIGAAATALFGSPNDLHGQYDFVKIFIGLQFGGSQMRTSALAFHEVLHAATRKADYQLANYLGVLNDGVPFEEKDGLKASKAIQDFLEGGCK